MMSGLEEITFKALSAGGGNIPFADEDASTIPSTPGQCSNSGIFSSGSDDLKFSDNRGLNNLQNFNRVPLLKSSTESSVPSINRYQKQQQQHQHDVKLSLRKSRTDGCVPFFGAAGAEDHKVNINPIQRYENAVLKYNKNIDVRYTFADSNDRLQHSGENLQGYSSSDESFVRNNKTSKSTNSIDDQSVNNILDQYEELDYRRSSEDLSDVESIDVTNFEATMNVQRQRELSSRLKKPTILSIEETNGKLQSSLGKTDPKSAAQKIAVLPSTNKVEEVEEVDEGEKRRVDSTEVEILLRKGEVQKRVDEWLSQTQNVQNNFKIPKDRGLVRSNSSSCYRFKNVQDSRSNKLRSAVSSAAGNEEKEILNVALSCDELNNDKEDKNVKIERKQLTIVDKVSVGVNTSRGHYKDYLANRSKTKQKNDEKLTNASVKGSSSVQRMNLASKIPQRGNLNSLNYVGNKETEGKKNQTQEFEREEREKEVEEEVEVEVEVEEERVNKNGSIRNRPLAIPTRRSSLKRVVTTTTTSSNVGNAGGGKEVVGESTTTTTTTTTTKVWANAKKKGLEVLEQLVTSVEPLHESLPNKDRESRRPLAKVREDRKTDGGSSSRSIDTSTLARRRDEFNADRDKKFNTGIIDDEMKNKTNNVGKFCSKLKSFQVSDDQESSRKGPPVPRKVQTSNYVKCTRLSNPVSSFKPNNAMYATLQGDNNRDNDDDDDDDDTFATSLGNESVTRSHYATPKQIEKIYERPRIRRDETPQVIHVDDIEAILKPNVTSTVTVYGDKPLVNSREKLLSSSSSSSIVFGNFDEDVLYAQVGGEARCNDLLETIMEDHRKERGGGGGGAGCTMNVKESGYLPEVNRDERDISNLERRFGTVIKSGNGNNKTLETIYASPRITLGIKQFAGDLQSKNTFTTFRSAQSNFVREVNIARSDSAEKESIVTVAEDDVNNKLDKNLDANSLYESRIIRSSKIAETVPKKNSALLVNGIGSRTDIVLEEIKTSDKDVTKSTTAPAVVNAIFMKTLRFEQDLPPPPPPNVSAAAAPVVGNKIEQNLTDSNLTNKNSFNSRDVLSNDYDNVLLQDSMKIKEEKLYVTKEEMEHEKLMNLLRKGDFEAAKSELERSYTLSTPGGGSPICCPPCSPPPAPTAYISSARASSRRLGVGGPSSPERDPLGRLLRFLKTFYRELGTRDPPHLPAWAAPLPSGTLCPAHFQPHLQLIHKSEQEHRLENIKLDQIFAPVRLSDGSVSEAPRRVAIEGGPGSGRTTLCLRLLHQWSTQPDGGSPALALIVPLRELRGSLLLNYLSRELLPRTSALGDAVAQVWRTLHLMEDRVLFVLDGYDECVGGRASLGDAIDLLEGRLFPDARIIVTCSPKNSPALSPLVQRRINLAGLEWPHVERLCAAYFIHNDIAERVRDFLEVLNSQPHQIRQLGQHPLGWVMLCALYQDSGNLPDETSALIQAAVKCIVKRSLDPPVLYNEEIPGHCRKRLEDFGKLSLSALREGRCCYTEAELRARGGGIEVTRLGFLTRGLTFGQRRKPDLFTPIHSAVAEFLAAYYLTSVAQYANILRRELEGLPNGIIGHLAGLLGPKTHLILNQLCPLEVPPRAVFSLLKSAGSSDGNIAAVCRLVGAGPGFGPAPNEPRSAPLVHTVPLELEGWARILESSACTLEALEVVFQVERGSDPRYLDDFFEALATNESVKLVRITSLLGHEFPADEAQRLARNLKSVLGKKRLNDFELVITCLEESAHDRLECVVSSLCRGLKMASPQLARLVLDMNLSGEQVSRVCEALRSCVQVQALHLPHLGCGREGLASVAELLKERPLLALNLAGSWGAKNEDPSSSGISMGSGSGSGSSGCASSTLGTLPLNRCYSSLPRGAPTVYGSLTRPATLPRLPLGLGPVQIPNDRDSGSKRNSDSVLCHRLPLLHPLPTCDLSSHQGTGFHEIFSAIREPSCKLRSLNVSKCLLGSLDAGCLAETIRRARHLDALRAAGASRPADMMPLVLAITEAPCLQLLDLASPRLALDDHPSRLLCHALARNSTLKLLSLEGWTFRIEESDSLSVFSELLRCTSVRELSLCNARLHLAVHEGPLSRLGRRDDAGAELLRAAAPPACPAIVFLRLAGFQVTVNDRLALRGPLLLPFLGGFTSLSDLDLSLDKSTIGGSSGSLLFIDDKILTNFFHCLSNNFKNLQSLRVNFWRITLEDCDRTMRQISKYLKSCNLSFLKMNGLIVTDSVKKIQIEHNFLNAILTNLQYLNWLCIDGIELTEAQASVVGKSVRDRFPGSSLEISAKDINVKSVKSLVATIEDGGRAEVVYTGGAHCRLRISKVQKNGKHKKK